MSRFTSNTIYARQAKTLLFKQQITNDDGPIDLSTLAEIKLMVANRLDGTIIFELVEGTDDELSIVDTSYLQVEIAAPDMALATGQYIYEIIVTDTNTPARVATSAYGLLVVEDSLDD